MTDNTAAQIAALRRYRSVVTRYLNTLAKKLGMNFTDLTAVGHLINAHQAGQVLSPGDLGELLSLSGPATTSVVDRLESQGWVERRRDAHDGRRLGLHLNPEVATEPGTTILAGMGEVIKQVSAKHSQEELNTFTTILDEVSEGLAFALENIHNPQEQHLWGVAPTHLKKK